MNTNHASKVSQHELRNLTIVCLSALLFVSAAFSQTLLRPNCQSAFTSSGDGNRKIYTINPGGTGLQRLTFNSGTDDYPSFSPDWRRIVYLNRSPEGQFFIKTMRTDGNAPQPVTTINFNLNTVNSGFVKARADFRFGNSV